MIDASRITNFNQSQQELQESLFFWVMAAGKNGTRAAAITNQILTFLNNYYPNENLFEQLKHYDETEIARMFAFYKTGCQNIKARTVYELIHSNIDLASCTAQDLENVYGIGRKTSRCFIVHSRKDTNHACLDTHILKFLRLMGIPNVPKSTPASRKSYEKFEKIFLQYASKYGMTPAELDLLIWNEFKVVN